MKKTLLITILFSVFVLTGFAQIQVIEHGTPGGGTVNLNNATQTITFNTDNIDHVYDVWVENTSATETYTIRCRRIETDVLANTRNNVCWNLCPIGDLLAGEDEDWVVSAGPNIQEVVIGPGEINESFAFHYKPEGLVGMSTFEVRFVNAADEDDTYASFNIVFDHDGVDGIDELEEIQFEMMPNPANETLSMDLSSVTGNVEVKIFNVLGEVMIDDKMVQGGMTHTMNTSDLRSGIYMVSVVKDNQILKTSRLMVKH